MREVTLFQPQVSFSNPDKKLILAIGDTVGYVAQNRPRDGLFPASDNLFGSRRTGGLGIAGMMIDFYVGKNIAEVPALAGIWFNGIGVAAMTVMRRQHYLHRLHLNC